MIDILPLRYYELIGTNEKVNYFILVQVKHPVVFLQQSVAVIGQHKKPPIFIEYRRVIGMCVNLDFLIDNFQNFSHAIM